MYSVILLASCLNSLNDNKIIKLKTKYPVLRTRKKLSNTWWNSLSYEDKVEVGSIAIHYDKITANYKWMCYDKHLYTDLTKSQKNIVDFIFNKRYDNWYMFNLENMIK